jgi:hypothetical protein
MGVYNAAGGCSGVSVGPQKWAKLPLFWLKRVSITFQTRVWEERAAKSYLERGAEEKKTYA